MSKLSDLPTDRAKVVHLAAMAAARTALRWRGQTRQAGFTSERIPSWLFRHRPILFDDGEAHDAHRKELARFFAPKVLRERYGGYIEREADAEVARAVAAGGCVVDELALHFSVRVASHIIGLTHSDVPALAHRLTKFFEQPPVVHTRPDYGRTTKQWIEAARKALVPLVGLYLNDVRPAIRARKRRRERDVISYLIDRGYTSSEILMECMTYGTAGMVTTREFICAALWRLLREPRLRERYELAGEGERHAILHEIIRLEPPVGHLYRRVLEPDDEVAAAAQCPYQPGTLIDIDVRAANVDIGAFGDDAEELCPERGLPSSERSGLSFGDGAHRCPGAPLAMLETDALILALLRARPEVVTEPRADYDTLVQGYQLREFRLVFAAS